VLLGLQRDSESLMDYFDSVMCLLLTLEVRILQMIPQETKAFDKYTVKENRVGYTQRQSDQAKRAKEL
jgi:hypothetical protein